MTDNDLASRVSAMTDAQLSTAIANGHVRDEDLENARRMIPAGDVLDQTIANMIAARDLAVAAYAERETRRSAALARAPRLLVDHHGRVTGTLPPSAR
jgi:hypothetical protein